MIFDINTSLRKKVEELKEKKKITALDIEILAKLIEATQRSLSAEVYISSSTMTKLNAGLLVEAKKMIEDFYKPAPVKKEVKVIKEETIVEKTEVEADKEEKKATKKKSPKKK